VVKEEPLSDTIFKFTPKRERARPSGRGFQAKGIAQCQSPKAA
jgi:hypothetical protein